MTAVQMGGDRNFIDLLKVLDEWNVGYYVTNGTLLGLVRDHDLIQWDHDVDVCIRFDPDFVNRLTHYLIRIGFVGGVNRRRRPGEYPVFKFDRDGGRTLEVIWADHFFDRDFVQHVEQSWYKTDKPDYVNSRGFFFKHALRACNSLYRKKPLVSLLSSPSLSVRCYDALISLVLGLLERGFGLNEQFGYQYSVEMELSNPRYILYFDQKVIIPKNSEEVCEAIYGESWREPKRSEHWTEFLK